MNVEQAREVFRAARLSLFALSVQLQMPQTTICRTVKYLSSYSKLVDLCVWILFVWYQKVKVSCMLVFRDEGSLEPTEMLSRENRTNPLTWEVM